MVICDTGLLVLDNALWNPRTQCYVPHVQILVVRAGEEHIKYREAFPKITIFELPEKEACSSVKYVI